MAASSSFRKDSGVSRAAAARRRQRAPSSNPEGEQSGREASSDLQGSSTAAISRTDSSSRAQYAGSQRVSSTEAPHTSSTKTLPYQRQLPPDSSHGYEGLMERNRIVEEEAAMLLASARKKPANAGGREPQPRQAPIQPSPPPPIRSSRSKVSYSKPVATSRVEQKRVELVAPAVSSTKMEHTSFAPTISELPPLEYVERQSSIPETSAAQFSRLKPPSPPSSPPADTREDIDEDAIPEDDNIPEELTIEELEAVVPNAKLDPACLRDESKVFVRGRSTKSCTLQAVDLDDDVFGANVKGQGVGRPHEILTLAFLEAAALDTDYVLRYGDRVALRSAYSNGRNLGVRSIPENGRSSLQVGFFRPAVGKAEQWMVLRVVDGRVVRVGTSVKPIERSGPTAPVRVGEGILLRNCHTGGILAYHEDGEKLRLITDSYDPDRVRHGLTSDQTLLGRMHRSDLLVPSDAETFYFLPSAMPPVPLWIGSHFSTDERKFMNGSYLLDPLRHDRRDQNKTESPGVTSKKDDPSDTRSFAERQERLLLDDLLGSFLGLEGTCIKAKSKPSGGLQFELREPEAGSFGPIQRSLAETMLPLANAFVHVRTFVASRFPGYEYGYVMQALCTTLDRLLSDYMRFMVTVQQEFRQNEEGLTMRGLLVQVRSSLHSMVILQRIVEVVQDCKGGKLLNTLCKYNSQEYNGDIAGDKIFGMLLESASVPYLEILEGWLRCGDLEDPCNEFMVQHNDKGAWEDKYVVAPEHILEGYFSTKQTIEKVLAAGRFWNAVRECQGSEYLFASQESCPTPGVLKWNTSTATISSYVQTMYERASKTLLRPLFDEFDFMGALQLLKRYLLLDHGDFFVIFMDSAEGELVKEVNSMSRGRVQNWLNLALQVTENNTEDDTFEPSSRKHVHGRRLRSTDIRCRFALDSLAQQLDTLHAASGGIDTHEPWTPQRHVYGGSTSEKLTGLNSFMLDFSSIPFPISLVLSGRTLESYQLLFRHIFFAKHVERRLVGIWKDHQAMKELQSLRGFMGSTFLLRQRMLHFMQNLMYYMMFEVIEPKWLEMQDSIASPDSSKEQSVDDILQIHQLFLQRALEACLLTNRSLVRALTKLMKTCLLFSDQMKHFMKATKIDEERHTVAIEKQKMITQNLNDRGGSRAHVSAKHLYESTKKSRVEREERIQRETLRTKREISSESYQRMISRFEEVFSENLRDFMQHLSRADDLYHSQKINLCIRLDYNGYVTSAMGLTDIIDQ